MTAGFGLLSRVEFVATCGRVTYYGTYQPPIFEMQKSSEYVSSSHQILKPHQLYDFYLYLQDIPISVSAGTSCFDQA